MKSLPLLLAVALLGGVAGFFLARKTSAPAPFGAALESSRTGSNFVNAPSGASSPGGSAPSTAKPATPLRPFTAAELTSTLDSIKLFENFGGSLEALTQIRNRIRISDVEALAVELCNPDAKRGTAMAGFGASLVFEVLAEKNPKKAWALATSTKDRSMRLSAIRSVVSPLVRQNPDQALAMIAALPDLQVRNQAHSLAISALARKDPARAFSLVTDDPGAREGIAIYQVFTDWVATDLEAAKAAAASLSGPPGDQARRALAHTLADRDPEAAWAYAKELTFPTDDDPRATLIGKWARNDPQAALHAAMSIEQSGKRNEALGAAVSSWAESDFDAALAYATTMDNAGMKTAILQRLSQQDQGHPAKLLDAVLDHIPPGHAFTQAVNRIISFWAKSSPSEAAAAVANLPPGNTLASAAQGLAVSWLSSGGRPEDVLRWARSLPQGNAQNQAYDRVFDQWSREDPRAAVQALTEITGTARKEVVNSIVTGWSTRAPEEALRWASSAPIQDEERSRAISIAVGGFVAASPEKAAAAVTALPAAQQEQAIPSLIRAWSSQDLNAAAKWTEMQATGKIKDASLRAVAEQIVGDDPASAMAWVSHISDAKNRERAMVMVVQQWKRADPATAASWVATSPLPEEVRKVLMK